MIFTAKSGSLWNSAKLVLPFSQSTAFVSKMKSMPVIEGLHLTIDPGGFLWYLEATEVLVLSHVPGDLGTSR
jgi:hypothetical protein